MTGTCKIDFHRVNALICPARIDCGNAFINIKDALLDTGAGICHMSYRLWCDMGMNEVCFNENKPLLSRIGITTPEMLTFQNLPLERKNSILGNESLAVVYEFKADKVTLGVRALGFEPITLNNITIRVIESDKAKLLIGLNVLKYLTPQYAPSIQNLTYSLFFDEPGKQLFEHDRKNRVSNYMQNRFNYFFHETVSNHDTSQ